MRRILFWFLPCLGALVGAGLFGYGFNAVMTGNTGVPVNVSSTSVLPVSPTLEGPIRTLLLGDSLARGAGDPTGLGIGGAIDTALAARKIPHNPSVNLAVSGSRTADLEKQLVSPNVRRLIAESTVIVVSIGGNDLFWNGLDRVETPVDPDGLMTRVLGEVSGIIGTIRETNPRGRIYVIGLYNPFAISPEGRRLDPWVHRWNAKLIDQFREDQDLTIVQTSDLFAHRDRLSLDRFHPGAEGYRLIGTRIADSL